MNWGDTFLWGLIATTFLTSTLSGAQSVGWTRMSITFMLGSMFTADRDRAKVYGFLVHFVNGWLFAILYALLFESMGMANWWLGGLMGLIHGVVVVMVMLPIIPGFHPRMVSEFAGPEPTRLLEPPGFMALNYGYGTPIVSIIGHIGFGVILGSFYTLS